MKNEKIACTSEFVVIAPTKNRCTVRLITMLFNGSTHFLNFQTVNYDYKYTRENLSVRLSQFSSVKMNSCVRPNHFTSPEKK